MELGYACINMNLSRSKIMTNRTMRRKTFDSKGLSYVSDLSLQNVKDLKTIVKWNNEFGIKLFRLSSQIFPWMEEYDFTELKDYSEIFYTNKGEISGIKLNGIKYLSRFNLINSAKLKNYIPFCAPDFQTHAHVILITAYDKNKNIIGKSQSIPFLV